MDNRNTEMTNKRNILGRFFRILVMLHKIPYAHFTEWNNKRKHKALAAGVYCLLEYHPGICPVSRHIPGSKGTRRVRASGKRAAKDYRLWSGGPGGAAVGHSSGIF